MQERNCCILKLLVSFLISLQPCLGMTITLKCREMFYPIHQSFSLRKMTTMSPSIRPTETQTTETSRQSSRPIIVKEAILRTKMVSPDRHQFPGVPRIIMILVNTNTATSQHSLICNMLTQTHSRNVYSVDFFCFLGHSPRY